MYKTIAEGAIKKELLGFGDEMVVDIDEETARLRVSIFQDCHFQDEAIIELRELLKEEC